MSLAALGWGTLGYNLFWFLMFARLSVKAKLEDKENYRFQRNLQILIRVLAITGAVIPMIMGGIMIVVGEDLSNCTILLIQGMAISCSFQLTFVLILYLRCQLFSTATPRGRGRLLFEWVRLSVI